MKNPVKNWHLIILYSLLLLVLKYELIYGIILFLYEAVKTSFVDPASLLYIFDFSLIDMLVSFVLLLIIISVTFIKRNRIYFLNQTVTFISFTLIILISFLLLAPVISPFNPEFQKNLSVTRLLSPLSSKKLIHIVNDEQQTARIEELKNSILKKSFNEDLIIADNLVKGENLVYYQKGKRETISYSKVTGVENTIYLLGTDELGRDIFSRLVYGARVSLLIGFGAVAVSFIIGLLLGSLSGLTGGFWDSLINRVTDTFLAFPIIFLIILFLALFGSSLLTVIIVLGLSGWMGLYKIVRSEVLSIRSKDYFNTAKMIGLGKKDLLIKEILPVIIVPVISSLVLQYGNVILAEAALSYLGLSSGSGYPSWGGMINSGQNYLTTAWWMIFFPSIALFCALFTVNDLGRRITIYYNPGLAR